MRLWTGCLLLLISGLLCSCDGETEKPYLKISGGGFIFNYRIGEGFYGFVLKPGKSLPDDTEIVAEFENPSGGLPFTIRQIVRPELIQYMFRTPAVTGVVKNQPYQVKVTLLNKSTGKQLAEITKTFRSNIDQSDLPDKALTVGPGYHPNPALK